MLVQRFLGRPLLVALFLAQACATQTPVRGGPDTQAEPATPGPSTPDSVDAYVRAEMARIHIPGLSLAVVRAGKVVKATGYGVADVERREPVTPTTVFKIGSTSKQFLATGIMLLAQDGKLSVDDPISKFFAGTPPSWSEITLRHFLTHTSGVEREGPAYKSSKVQPDSVVVRSTFADTLLFRTGSKWSYCNVCYFALADVIARVSGKPWDVFLTQRVFTPVGMTSTATTLAAPVPNSAQGYVWKEKSFFDKARYALIRQNVALRPSGAFRSTVLDLAKWDAALYRGDVLTRASRDAMWTQMKTTDGTTQWYGFGWFVGAMRGHRWVAHGGNVNGFSAAISRYLDDSLTVIILTNKDGESYDELADQIAGAYVPALRPRAQIALDSMVLERYVGAYETAPGVFTVITRDRGQLMSRLGPQQSLLPIVPESRTRFFARTADVEIDFSGADAQGRPASMTIHQNGRDQVAARNDVESPRLVAAAAAFAKRYKDQTPVAGGEAALRRLIEQLAAGKPDYALMTIPMAAAIRQQVERNQAALAPLGPIQSLTFKGVGPGGADIYTVRFAKGVLEWRIWLSPDGKIDNANNRPAPQSDKSP